MQESGAGLAPRRGETSRNVARPVAERGPGRLRHLAQACAPRVNTAGLLAAWSYGLTFVLLPLPPSAHRRFLALFHATRAPSRKIYLPLLPAAVSEHDRDTSIPFPVRPFPSFCDHLRMNYHAIFNSFQAPCVQVRIGRIRVSLG